jgi:hypothetical protein
MNMKTRLTVTIDPDVLRRAKKLAVAQKTNVSSLVEELLRRASVTGDSGGGDFVTRWAGKLTVATAEPGDERMAALKTKYGLAPKPR